MEESAEIDTQDNKKWDIRGSQIKDEAGHVKFVIELARNVTEKMNLQADAARTRHLASIGELAAGVAHEINNPINNVINYAQILLDEFSEESRDDEVARRSMRDGERIAIIVRSLLSFARIRKVEKIIMDMQEIFADTMALTSAQLRKDGIHLDMDIHADELRVFIHPQQIQQVFLNIISNARYALNKKFPESTDNKMLKIRCREIILEGRHYASTEFTDYGTGIPADLIEKVINPFFSVFKGYSNSDAHSTSPLCLHRQHLPITHGLWDCALGGGSARSVGHPNRDRFGRGGCGTRNERFCAGS